LLFSDFPLCQFSLFDSPPVSIPSHPSLFRPPPPFVSAGRKRFFPRNTLPPLFCTFPPPHHCTITPPQALYAFSLVPQWGLSPPSRCKGVGWPHTRLTSIRPGSTAVFPHRLMIYIRILLLSPPNLSVLFGLLGARGREGSFRVSRFFRLTFRYRQRRCPPHSFAPFLRQTY